MSQQCIFHLCFSQFNPLYLCYYPANGPDFLPLYLPLTVPSRMSLSQEGCSTTPAKAFHFLSQWLLRKRTEMPGNWALQGTRHVQKLSDSQLPVTRLRCDDLSHRFLFSFTVS